MGGTRPRQSHGVSVLPDDAGVASVAERHTRGTDVLRLSKMHRLEPGGSGPVATRPRLPHYGGGELPGLSAGGWGGRGDVLRGSHGDVAGAESDASSAERSTSEHGNRPWSARVTRPAWSPGLGTPSVDRPGVGRSRRSSRRSHDLPWRPGEPATGRRAAVVSRSLGNEEKVGGCNAERCATER
jgi:hypothetical protein